MISEIKEVQKFYMICREMHEHLAVMQTIAEKNGIFLKGYPTLAEINIAIRQYHNMARILEDDIKPEGIPA